MDYQSDLRSCIWPKEDRYFADGLSEIIFEIRDLIYPSLETIREDFIFINIITIYLLVIFCNKDR